MNKIIIILLVSCSSVLAWPGTTINPTIAGGSSVNVSNIVNATNIYNAGGVTNGQNGVFVTSNLAVGVYSTVTYSVTNPFDLINAYENPQAVGHYVWSTVYSSYTNSARTNILFFKSGALGAWVVDTNFNDSVGNGSLYAYFGANSFPTNDIANWITGNPNTGDPPSPFTVDIGTLATSNNAIINFASAGITVENIDDASGNNFITYNDFSGHVAQNIAIEVSGQNASLYTKRYGWPITPGWTNDNNAAHSYALGTQLWRDKAFCDNLIGDPTVFQLYGILFGKAVLTNNAPDLTHVGDLGGILEFDVRGNITNYNAGSVIFTSPLKLHGNSSVELGNVPVVTDHGFYTDTPGFVYIRKGTASMSQLVFEGSPTYTGIKTNGFWSDGTRIWAIQQGIQMSIPQIQNTNLAELAASTFTWTFTSAFADTNYSVSFGGGGTALAAPIIGAKTTSTVVVSFTAFTGILNLTASHQ